MKLRKPPQEENVDSWLMSYADMITLLLAFFIIFVSISEPKQDKLSAATKGMQEQFGSLALESPYDQVFRNVAGVISTNQSQQTIAVERTPAGIRLEFSSARLFLPGTAEISPEARPVLTDIMNALKAMNLETQTVTIEGHTGPAPTMAEPFTNTWEFSSARAIAVLKALNELGIPANRLAAAAYADTRPLLPNMDAGGYPILANQQRNERILVRVEQGR